MSDPVSVIEFLHIIEKLKVLSNVISIRVAPQRTKRTGWLNYGVQGPESVSDHMHRMGVMAMVIDDKDLDINNSCALMPDKLYADLALYIGDITPHQNVSKEEKYKLERDTMEYFCSQLGETPQSCEIRDLWQEYEDVSSSEAKLVKDLDKFEMILQALEYEKADGKRLDEFFDSTRGRFVHPTVKAWVEVVYKERRELWESKSAEVIV
ncbi:LOW QUALITY PROTEIN: HD domain-containing protein [Endogone sp. FLAS-F59071]|nr:LOW QUALITY PROTEIN: HD domain-containing protein [Endogone sp. FLAS-F59071]|eukprot:RUS23008.1 LOW QUALITY PROTEIN: HD domain-containing protein [Endogone sp. FLAS-F59071]